MLCKCWNASPPSSREISCMVGGHTTGIHQWLCVCAGGRGLTQENRRRNVVWGEVPVWSALPLWGPRLCCSFFRLKSEHPVYKHKAGVGGWGGRNRLDMPAKIHTSCTPHTLSASSCRLSKPPSVLPPPSCFSHTSYNENADMFIHIRFVNVKPHK